MSTITIPRAIVQQALEALDDAIDHLPKPNSTDCGYAITALRAALAQQEPLPERELFEHWAQEQRLALNRHAHSYASTATAWCWDAWAARAALAQQEQAITPAELSAALGWPGGISEPVLDKAELLKMVANARVEQPEQEPVASIYVTIGGEREFDDWRCPLPVGRNLLYTHPPRREWQGLTEEEFRAACWCSGPDGLTGSREDACRAIEQALRSKNNG